jgi:hypothetical protein
VPDFFVMPGLVPGIHVLLSHRVKDVDGRDKPGHDVDRSGRSPHERSDMRGETPDVAALIRATTIARYGVSVFRFAADAAINICSTSPSNSLLAIGSVLANSSCGLMVLGHQ